ncbi:MAG: hypothetical protein JXA90_17285 [Planctomycetes bacterium]|nr:hypothetical protein [Planctomycetota bacterium]
MRARYLLSAATLCVLLLQPAEAPAREAGEAPRRLRARISWGHASRSRTPFRIRLLAREASLVGVRGSGLEAGEISAEPAWETIAGGGDVDGVEATIVYPPRKIEESGQIHAIWKDLIAASDADTARRLLQDPAVRTDGRRLVVAVGCDGAAGFSITVDQLLERRTFWIPSLDIFVDANDPPVSFEEHQRQIAAWKGKRILEQVHARPEASYEEFTALWEDMGSPSYVHPSQPAPGHIVGLTWDSALYKFGIDRGAGVWNDYGNPDRFRFWFGFGDLSRGIRDSWRGQSLADGLPIITTVIEDEGLRFEVEQFAYPLRGPPAERRGDIPMLLLQMVRVSDLRHEARRVSLPLHHRRQFPAGDASPMVHESRGGVILFRESSARRVLFAVQGAGADVSSCETAEDASPRAREGGARWKSFRAAVSIEVPAGGSREILVCLPSPPVAPQDEDALLAIDGAAARAETVRFWTEWIERGAQFRAPEKVVDDLFRASLWHALCLPRRHGGGEEGVRIDLPYSNFAYDQAGTPWPVNQAVYVDYMIHDLRGYHDVSLEELLAIYRNNQDRSGRVRGYANWGVYTPSMVYVAAKHFLLSGDRAAFERILPPALAALDWCLAEIRRSSERSDPTSGLIRSPLNDLTGEGIWAFTQAYVHAALESMGMALERLGHPRAAECRDAARDFRISVERAFGAATARSPLVELRDRTWTPYVP